ncbi:MAG: bifunctional folylpolyglutamate synthase/dihydrofolate synthase [Candidatus Gastranaerophilaceae bacterium]
MINSDYEKTKKLLTSSGKFRIKLGLERISAIMEILGNPQNKIKVIHIAGTNGKGSVSAITAEILKCSGYKTGLYTSPHLYFYTERIKINDNDISNEDFTEYISNTEKLAKDNSIDLTEFEILTAAAYKYFYDNKVDFAVMETGLGGRFDAVNIVEKPIISVITSISIDHKDRLGDTIEKIAFEKAGIIKKNCPVAVNLDNKGLDVISKICDKMSAKLFTADKKIDIKFENGENYALIDGVSYQFALWGLHQKQNLSLVCKVVEILQCLGVNIQKKSFEQALRKVFLPARFQYIKEKNMILDGSHNADAANVLRRNLDFYFPDIKRIWIYGTLSTKEYDKVVNTLFRAGDKVFLYKFNHNLSVSEDEICKKIIHSDEIKIEYFSKTANTLNFSPRNYLIIVTGSFYMIGDLLS